ncbi:MAG: hypothetical protein AAF748_12745 [Pseudomonadota bacterium]
MKTFLSAWLLVGLASMAQAQMVLEDCGSWQGSARNVPEPWDQYSRIFANGAVRITLLDTIEPAAGAFYLMIQSPPYDELGIRQCVIIMDSTSMGFAGLEFMQLQAAYDPATGLIFRLPATLFAPATGGFDPAILAVTVNQATGNVFARFELP